MTLMNDADRLAPPGPGNTATERLPEPQDLAQMLEKIRPLTMVGTESLVDLAHQVQAVLTSNLPGDRVECGVWRGGASFLMAALLKEAGVSNRKVWLFDSFEGLPAPDQIDGEFAAQVAE